MNETDSSTFVGIDIGGTFTRLAVVDTHGRVLADRRTETPTTGQDLIRWLDNAYRICRDETDSLPAPRGMGVGVPGVLEPGRSAVSRAINLPVIEGLPLRDMLIERTGLATWVDCDTVTAAWGEYCARQPTALNGFGGGGQHQDPTEAHGLRHVGRFAYLTIGTAVGAAVIIDSEILRHTDHSIGHLGQMICDTDDDAPRCRSATSCGWRGPRGSLEAVVAAPAIIHAAQAHGLLAVGSRQELNDLEIALQRGDAPAARFVEKIAKPLAVAFSNIAHSYAIDLLVVGGGVAQGLPSLIRRADALAERMLDEDSLIRAPSASAGFPTAFSPMRVELSALADYAGVVGAALLAAKQLQDRAP